MAKVLVEFSTNWADEIDLSGFKIYDKLEWEELVAKVSLHKSSFQVYFGTNESNEYENGEALLEEYTISHLNDSDAEVIMRLLGGEYGMFEDPLEVFEFNEIDIDEEE